MHPCGKKHVCPSVTPDILDILPEKAINSILMRLPLREATRTSILSKNWRYIWCRLQHFVLDQSLWDKSQSSDPTPRFKDIVYHLLTLRAGSVTKFTLSIPTLKNCPKIDNFIYFLARNDIQHLVLKLPIRGDPYKLPSSIFTCLQLRHLILESCLIPLPPSTFKGFDMLINLELRRVKIPSIFLESLISTCPLLEKLVLFITECSTVIEINAPMLRSFDFTGSVTSICLKTVPRLAKLQLLHYEFDVVGKIDVAKFFESFSALEDLHLNDNSVELFARARGAILKRFPFDINCVKRLYLDRLRLGKLKVITCFLCLIRSFPCLQYMEIELEDDDEDISAFECLEVEASSNMTFDHLREVKLIYFIGSKPEMQLIKLLLAKSPLLVRMLIEASGVVIESATIKMLTELTKFKRASPNVEVDYTHR